MANIKPIENFLSRAEANQLYDAVADIQNICKESSNSQFFPYGGEGYKSSIRHYLESSSEIAFAAVQPGNAEDLSKIIKVLGRTKAPFAVKGGGHSTNPKFSSTKDVGAGCLFDEVYRVLSVTCRNIVGGSAIAGVGIAGWLLGGGYSLKTNQYGLGIDNLLGIKIVLPNGDIEFATKNYNSTLLAAVKGGGNNFGIVTEFTLATHEQSTVFGGLLEYEAEEVDDVKQAVEAFVKHYDDPKASIVAAFRHYNTPGGEQFKLTIQYFYDGPKPSPNPFQKFFDIPHASVFGGGAGAGQEHSLQENKARHGDLTLSYFDFDHPLQENKACHGDPNLSYFDFDHAISGISDDTIFDVVNPHLEHYDSDGNTSFSEFERKNFGIHNIDVSELVSRSAISQEAPLTGGRWGNEPLFSNSNYISVDSKNLPAETTVAPPLCAMAGVGENARGRWGNVMVPSYTPDIIKEVERQAKKAAKHMVKHGGKVVVVDIWPFHSKMFEKSDHNSAWPHQTPNGPLLVLFQWEGQENDEFWVAHMKCTLKTLESKVSINLNRENTVRPVYANTALADSTTVADVFQENLPYLSSFRTKVDPNDVMGQAGGFRIPLLPDKVKQPEVPSSCW